MLPLHPVSRPPSFFSSPRFPSLPPPVSPFLLFSSLPLHLSLPPYHLSLLSTLSLIFFLHLYFIYFFHVFLLHSSSFFFSNGVLPSLPPSLSSVLCFPLHLLFPFFIFFPSTILSLSVILPKCYPFCPSFLPPPLQHYPNLTHITKRVNTYVLSLTVRGCYRGQH